MNEKETVIAVMKGDEKAFEELVYQYQNRALRTAFLICQNKDMAQDILQESFIRCYLNISQLKNPEVFRSWFYKILTRTAYEMMKKEKNYLSVEEPMEKFPDTFQDNVWDSYMQSETYQILRKEIQRLDIKQRTVLIMYYLNGLSVQEIAEATDSLQGTVKSRLFFARKKLKSKLSFQKDFKEEWE